MLLHVGHLNLDFVVSFQINTVYLTTLRWRVHVNYAYYSYTRRISVANDLPRTSIPHARMQYIQKGTSESTVRCNSRAILLAMNSPVLLRMNLKALQHIYRMYPHCPKLLGSDKTKTCSVFIRQQSSSEAYLFPKYQTAQRSESSISDIPFFIDFSNLVLVLAS